MRFGSLFAGIGGLDLGLERAGLECAWQVEIDDWCRQVLAKHWPDVTRYEDVRTVGDNLKPVDLICGGFPCQDISNAGKRAGIGGERSGLWSEFARIIRIVQPQYVLVENVAALLGRGLGDVLGDLAACGYDAEWDCIPAASVGAPHRRDRIFVVAYAGRNGPHEQRRGVSGANREGEVHARRDVEVRPLADAEGVSEPLWAAEEKRQGGSTGCGDGPDTDKPRLEVWQDQEGLWEFAATVGVRQWAVEPDVGRMANGIPSRVDRLKGLGNAVVPQVAEYLGRMIVEQERHLVP